MFPMSTSFGQAGINLCWPPSKGPSAVFHPKMTSWHAVLEWQKLLLLILKGAHFHSPPVRNRQIGGVCWCWARGGDLYNLGQGGVGVGVMWGGSDGRGVAQKRGEGEK